MKELSVEEKAKAYDEAIEKLRDFYRDYDTVSCLIDVKEELANLFPELKESEDEKTRKEIIYHIKNCDDTIDEETEKRMLAWLENIPYTIDHEKREGFHLGYKAALEKQGESSDKIHYWTEEEIEPIISDYLRGAEHYGGMIGRLRCLKPKSLEKQGKLKSIWHNEDEEPQRDSLILLIMQSGTPIVAKIIEPNHTFNHGERWAYIDDLLEKQGKQKPAKTVKWSPQEESCICQLESLVKEQWSQAERVHNSVNIKKMQELMFFLKTLNPNKKPQRMISAEAKEAMYDKPACAWNEEDEEMCQETIDWFEKKCFPYALESENPARESIRWLKSLKDRYTWKPSDEQMNALWDKISNDNLPNSEKEISQQVALTELYEQLKKLREG